MRRDETEENWLDDAFRDEPKASAAKPAAGDEGSWLDDAFSDAAPVRRKMSGKAKAAIAVAVIAVLALLVLLGVETMNALGTFAEAMAS